MNNDNTVTNKKISITLEENYMPYVMSVIVSRAIPEIDGFKPAHRKLLYTMYKMGLLKGGRTKSANVVGQTMKLNPHGDAAIYETMVRLTRGHNALLHAYVDSKGNFGKSSSRDMKYAASRYTEVKLEKICTELFKNIDRDTVDFVDNYDGSMAEPTLLPTTFPNVLVNANKGIAVGMASSIASFNLAEVCRLTIAMLEGEDVVVSDYLNGPDFSTGGYLLYDEAALNNIYETGQGSVKLRCKYQYDKANKLIEITEIPYTTTVEAIIDKIVDLIKRGKIKEISDVRDETDLKGLKITLDLKRGTDPDLLMQKLYISTPLEDSFVCNFNILIKGKPIVLGVVPLLNEWIKYRLECLVRQLNYDLVGLNKKLHLLLALHKVLLDIDKAIKIIRSTLEDSAVVPNLIAAFEIDEVQANYVAEIKLRNLNKKYLINRITEIESLKDQIQDIEKILKSKRRQKKLICQELEQIIKNYAIERKTEIIQKEEVVEVRQENLIEDYNLKLFLTEHGYFKKISLTSLRAYSEQKTKDDDQIIQEQEATNLSEILFFTDKQNVYKVRAHELNDHKASELGSYLANVIEMEEDERVVFMHALTAYTGWFVFAFENGKVAKVPVSSYQTKNNRKKLLNAYGGKARLVSINWIEKDEDFIAVRTDNTGEKNVVLFSSELVNEKVTRNTQGVQVVRLKRNSYMSSMVLAETLSLRKQNSYRCASIPVSGSKINERDHFKYPML